MFAGVGCGTSSLGATVFVVEGDQSSQSEPIPAVDDNRELVFGGMNGSNGSCFVESRFEAFSCSHKIESACGNTQSKRKMEFLY